MKFGAGPLLRAKDWLNGDLARHTMETLMAQNQKKIVKKGAGEDLVSMIKLN